MASEVETHQSLVTQDNISLAKEKEEQTPDVSTNVTQKEEKQTDDGSSEEKVDSEQASAGEMNIRKTTGSENSSDEKLIEEDLSFRGGGTREKTAVILEPEKSEQIEKLRNSNEIEPVKTYDCDIQNLRISDDEKKDISSEAVCDSTQICAGRTTAYLQELCHKINEPNVSPADNDQKVEDNMKGEYLTHKEGNNESVLLKEDQNELTTLEEENNAENRQNIIEGSTSELGLDRKGEISETRDKELDNNQINVGERQITCIPVQSSVDEAAQHLKDGSEKEFIKEITELDTTSLDTTEVAIIPLNLSLRNISDSYVGKNKGDSQNYPAEEPQIEVNKAEVHSTVKDEGIGEILPQLKIKDETVTLSEDNPSQGLQTENTAGSEVVSPRNLRMKTDEQEVNLKYAEISESKNIYAVEEEVQFSSLQYSSEPQYFEEPISDPSQMLSREISGSRVNEAMQKETSNAKVAYVDQSSEPDRQKTNNESFQVDVEVSVMLVKDKEFHSHQTQAGEKEMNSEKELDSNGKQSAKLDEDVEQHTASSTDTTASDLNNKSYAATSEQYATEQSTDKETMEKKFYMMQETGNKDEAILREILSGNMPKQVTNELQGKQIDMLMPEGHRTVDETPFIEYSREYVSEQVDNQLHVLKAVAGFVTDKESTEETNSDDMHATHLRSQNISESGITRIQNETKAAQLCGSFETEEADIVKQIYTVDTRTDGVNSDHGDKNEETLMDVEAVVQNVDAKDATDRIVHSTNLSNEKTQLEQRMKEATIQEENCDQSNLEPDCMRVAASPKENIQLDPVEKAATCESSTSAEAEICGTAENSKVVDFTDREIAEEIQEGHGEHLGLRVVGEEILPEAEDSSNKTDDIDQATKVLEHNNHAQIIKEINEKDCERVIQGDRADEDSTKIQFPILLVTDMTEIAINQEQQDLNVEPTIQLTGSAVTKSDSIKDEKDGERTEQNVFTETDGTTSTEEKAKAKQRSQERHYESEKLNKEIIEVSIADTDINDANIGEDRGETIFGEQVQVIEHQEEAVIDEQQHCPQIGDSRVHNDGGTLEEESIVVSAQIEKDKSYSIKVEEDKNAMNDTSSIDFHDHEADFAENLKENKKIREMETLSCVKNIDMYDKEKFENVDESQEKLQLKEECQSTPTERKLEHCPKLLPEETADHKVITLGSTKAPQLSTQVNTCTYDEQIYGDKEADGLRESNEIDTKELRIEKVSLNQEFKLSSDSNCAPNEGAINDTGVSGETQEPRESNKIDGKEFPKEREIVNQGFEVHNSSQSAPKGDSTDTETFGDTNELYEITEINGKEFSTKKEILNQVFKVDGSSISAPNERASTHIEQSGGTHELCKSHEMDGKELYTPKEILNKGFEEENCNQSALNEGASTDVEASGQTHESCEYKGADGKSFSTEKEILHQGFEVDNRSQSTPKEASTDTKTIGETNDPYKTNQIDGKVFSTEKEIHNQGFNADGSSRSAANEGASPHVEQSGGTHELYKSNEMNGEELDTRKEILDEGFVEDNCNKSALNEGASIDVEASAEAHESCEYKATDGKSFSTEKEILHQGFEVDIGSQSAPNQVASVHIEAPAENKGAEKANQDQDKSAQVRQGGNTVSEEKKTAAGAEHDKLYCKDTKNRISKEEVIPETASTSKSEMALVFAEIKDDELVAHIAEQMSGECTAAQQNKPLDTDCGNPKRNEGTDRTIDLDEQKPIVRSMKMKENETSSQEGLLQSNTIDDVGVRMIEDMQSKDDKKEPPLKFQDLNQTASQEDGINRQPTLVVESGKVASTVIRATQFAEELVLGHSEKEVTSSDDIASFTNCQKVDDSIPYVTNKILVEQTKETEDKLWPASFASEATVTINDNAKNTTIQHILKEEKLEDFSFEKPTQEPGLSEQTQSHLMHSNFEPTKEPEVEEVTKIDDASVQRASDLSSDSQDDKDPLDVKASGDSERYSDICSQETKSEQTTDGVDHDSITKSISVEIGEPCKGVINIQGQIETPEHYKEQTTTEDDKIMSHKVEYPELTVEEKKYSDNHEPHRVTEPNTTEENQETSTENSPVDGEAHDPTASYGIQDTIIVKNEELDNQSLQNRDYGNENQSILENIQAKSSVRDEDNLTTNSADEFQVTEKKETAGVEKIQADTQIARTKDVAPIKELSYGDHIVVQHSLQPANSCDESEKFVMVDKTTMEPDPSGGKELDSTDTQRMFGEEQKPQETYDATYSNRQLESPIIGESKEKNQVDVNVQESKSTIGTKEKEGSSLPSVDPVIDSMDIKEKERTADKTQEIERKSVPTDSTKIYSLDLKQESTVQPLSIMGSKSEEGEQGTRKDKTQDGEEPTSVEQNTDEEKEEKEDKGERSLADSEDVMMISEPLTEMELKASHKKSHNILSGVGSKVKHSISKVKQAMACTSRQYSPEDVIIKLNKNKV